MKQCIEFEEWMSKEMITATSDEYGQDYEHLQVFILLYFY